MKKTGENFKQRKNNDKYWDGTKLYEQTVTKALFIVEALYLGYSLVFLFNNIINYFVYTENALCIKDINKSLGNK